MRSPGNRLAAVFHASAPLRIAPPDRAVSNPRPHRRSRLRAARLLAFALLALLPCVARAQDDDLWAPDVPEPGSVEKIREYTTGEQYLPRSVAYVPDSDRVPSPADVLGHIAGAPDELARVAQVHAYFRRLADATPRVRVRAIGRSEEGREIVLVTISSEDNLRDLERCADITARLADPRRTPRAEMQKLAAEGKPFYYLTGGLHSPETGSPEMLMELVYRLAVSEKPEIRAIREQVIVLVTPVVEVDGRDRQVDWYYRHVRDRKLPIEELEEFDSPPYWGKYVFHDNNRDGLQLTLALTNAVNDVYWQYHPSVLHDLHESVPLLYISSGHGPYTRAVDPVTISEWTQMANHEVGALQAQNLPGVWTWGFWDGWWPGYLFSVANNHNSIGRFYETFGNSSAGTFERKLKDDSFAGKPVTETQWYRAWPPDKKLRWSLRDNTNYTEAGVLAALGYTALHGRELLENFWIKGNRAVENGKKEKPYAWIFPQEQRDRRRLAYLLQQLQAQHIELRSLSSDFKVGDRTYATGSFVVRLDQPYRNAAITFLDKQDFPADEPNRPYDDVAWTWPLLYGVDAQRIDDRRILDAPMRALGPANEGEHAAAAFADLRAGQTGGTGDVFLVRDSGQTALLSARVALAKQRVEAADTSFTAGGVTYPPGSWIVHAPRPDVERVARDWGVDFTAVHEAPHVRRHALDLPRLAVMHTWISTQDCGWVRYTLDQAKVPYTLIHDGDLKRGGLRGRFDVILYPNSWGDFARQVHGIDPKYGPLAYTKTAQYPSHGSPDASPDITGGMGFQGLLNLQEFVEQGGVLVTLASAGILPVDGGIVRGVSRLPAGTLQSPGSLVRAKVLRPLHPIAYGYEELPSVFRGNGPLFDVEERDRERVVLQFGTKKIPEAEAADSTSAASGDSAAVGQRSGDPATPPQETATKTGNAAASAASAAGAPSAAGGKGNLVLSGIVKPVEKLDGLPAILDVPSGKGHVVLFAFNPMHRFLDHADFRFVYNVVLNWNDLPR